MVFSYVDSFVEKYADPRANNYLIGRSIWTPISIIILYLLFVYKIGPWYMKDKKPYNCRNWIIAFDILQIVVNGWFAYRAVSFYLKLDGTFLCLVIDTSNSPSAMEGLFLAYSFHLVKLSDMVDTVFFILKANYRQASYLHIYHHTIMVFFSWYALKFVPGGQSVYIGLVNSFMHVVMYSYYLSTSCNPDYKKNATAKQLVTTMQLAQFLFLGCMFMSSLRSSCNFSKVMSTICVLQASYFTYLFGKFYYENYIEVKPGKRRK